MRLSARRALTGAALFALTLPAAAGCGSSSSSAKSSPQAELNQAVGALYDSHALTVTVKLDASGARLQQLQASGAGKTGKPLSAAQAQALAGGSIVIAVVAGSGTFREASKAPSTRGGGAFSFTANAGGAPGLLEFRYVGKTLYARADVRTLAGYAHTDLSRLTAASTAAPAGLRDALQALLAGRWLSLPAAQLSGLLGGTATGGVSPSPNQSPTPGLSPALVQALTRDVQVTRVSGGTGPSGDHLRLTGSARKIAGDLSGALPGQLARLPGSLGKRADPSKVPDKQVQLDAYVKDGALSSVTVDLAQFGGSAGGAPLPVELDFTRTAAVTAPAGSVPLDLTKILGSLAALGGGGSLGALGSLTG